MLTTLVALASIFGGLIGIPTTVVVVRQSIRESRTSREKPLREALQNMTDERNYHRDRADAFETELRREN